MRVRSVMLRKASARRQTELSRGESDEWGRMDAWCIVLSELDSRAGVRTGSVALATGLCLSCGGGGSKIVERFILYV